MKFGDISESIINEQNSAKKAAKIAGAILTGVAPIVAYDMIEDKFSNKMVPVSRQNLESGDIKLPYVIEIVEPTALKDIEPNEDVIGGQVKVSGQSVIKLLDEATTDTKLTFLPASMPNTVYLRDSYSKNQYVCINNVYDQYQEHKLAELRHIAFSLGAKSYSVELYEEDSKETKVHGDTKAKVGKVGAAAEGSYESVQKANEKALAHAEFSRRREPKRPKLRIFKNDENILELINQVLNGEGTIQNHEIILEGSRYAVMSASAASGLDAVIKKLNVSASVNFKAEFQKESHRKMIYRIEF